MFFSFASPSRVKNWVNDPVINDLVITILFNAKGLWQSGNQSDWYA